VTIQETQKFIRLKAEGYSYDVITKKLNISKPTLLKAGRQLTEEIEKSKEIYYDEIITKQKLNKTNRLKRYSIILNKALQEIENRKLENFSNKELFELVKTYNNLINDLYADTDFEMQYKKGPNSDEEENTERQDLVLIYPGDEDIDFDGEPEDFFKLVKATNNKKRRLLREAGKSEDFVKKELPKTLGCSEEESLTSNF